MFPHLTYHAPILLLAMTTLTASAQEATEIPRTADGYPDLQGYWNNSSQTPIERPASLGDKRSYTADEAIALITAAEESDSEKAAPLDPGRAPPTDGGVIMFQADENFANTRINLTQINGEYRTSLIVEPEDGRFPYVEDGANKDIFGQWRATGLGSYDGPEIRSQMERCLHVGAQMPPMMAWTYNANYQIVQTADYLMLLSEMAHDARIIPIDAEHQSPGFSKWFGDSVAHWEDDTLVVHTTGFHPQQSNFFIKSSDQFEVTEYFSLLSEEEILYRYTVTDPVIYSQPYTIEMQLLRKADGEQIYEFACHEGNYSLPSILAGARRAEADAQAKQ
ncbi:MAG: hypothetical protein DHS20C12_09450 [Pseudohongiella sp.]|nr:MAG: hypothetical protein DHS20C12_09450 [Pseudohongiella sp.]